MTKLKRIVKDKVFTDYESLPLMLNVNDIAVLFRISKAGAYNLVNTKGFPKTITGKRIVVPKQQLIDWINSNTI